MKKDLLNSPKFSSAETSFMVPLTKRLSLRLYSDCRPSYLETAPIQKGLVLMLDGKELIGEGVGFGVPIAKYTDKTFFSGKAEVSLDKSGVICTLKKKYVLETVSIKKLGKTAYLNDKFYSRLRRTFQEMYLRQEKLKPLFNKAMEIRNLLGVKTEFQTAKPRGYVTVTYRCQPNTINIEADFSHIATGKCQEVLVLNEQGASIFQRYVDSRGESLMGNRIGAWNMVTADWASLQSLRGQLEFSVQNIGGSKLYRGWEHTRKRFSWAGLSYALPPQKRVFQYTIKLNFKDN